jgi:hypothetical protein
MNPRLPILITLSLLASLPLLADTPDQKNERIDPHLAVLKEPYQKVETEYYWDGGSIGIKITDMDGRTEMFAMPVHRKEGHLTYPELYVGTMWTSAVKPDPKAVLVPDPEATIKRLFEIKKPSRPNLE